MRILKYGVFVLFPSRQTFSFLLAVLKKSRRSRREGRREAFLKQGNT